MTLAIATITNSIAALNVALVHIRDIDEIPEAVNPSDCPIIYPKPDGFVTNFRVEVNSFGSSSAKKTVRYTLTYRFLQAALSSGRGLFDVYDDLVTNVFAFLDAVIANDALTGAIDDTPVNTINFGAVGDPAGNLFHGADIAIEIMEFVN